MYTSLQLAWYTEVYKDRDLIFSIYSSELWGIYDYKEIDKIQLNIYKILLEVKSQTSKKRHLLLFMGN